MKKKGLAILLAVLIVIIAAGAIAYAVAGDSLLGFLRLTSINDPVTYGEVTNKLGVIRADMFKDNVAKHSPCLKGAADGFCYIQGEALVEGKGITWTEYGDKLLRYQAAFAFDKVLGLSNLVYYDHPAPIGYSDITQDTYPYSVWDLGTTGVGDIKMQPVGVNKFFPYTNLTKGRADYWISNAKTLLASNVTRGDFAKYLVSAAGFDLISPAVPTFKDVPKTNINYAFIETLVSNGVVKGNSDGTFTPNSFLNRAEAAKSIYTAFEFDGKSESYCKDVQQTDWFYPYMSYLGTKGILVEKKGEACNPSSLMKVSDVIVWFTNLKK